MSRRKKRKSNNPAGRPRGPDSGAAYLIKLSPALLQSARDSAGQQGISLAEWWRNAAWRELGAAVVKPDPTLVE